MTPLAAIAHKRLLDDLQGILARGGMALGQLMDIRDRVFRAGRDLEAAEEGMAASLGQHFRECNACQAGPACDWAREISDVIDARPSVCNCGAPECQRAVCVGPEAA